MTTATTQQIEMFKTFESVGFNTTGHFGITETGERVRISKEDFDAVNSLADEFFAQADDFQNWVESMEANFSDMAEWQQAVAMGFTFS